MSFHDNFWVGTNTTRQEDELGKGRRVAETVREPHLLGLDAQLVEEPLAEDQLADE